MNNSADGLEVRTAWIRFASHFGPSSVHGDNFVEWLTAVDKMDYYLSFADEVQAAWTRFASVCGITHFVGNTFTRGDYLAQFTTETDLGVSTAMADIEFEAHDAEFLF